MRVIDRRQDSTLKYPAAMRAHFKKAANAYDERAACPLYTAIAVIDGRWKPMIYQRLMTARMASGS